MARKPVELPEKVPDDVGFAVTPHTSYLVKAVAGGLAVVSTGGLVYGWENLRAIPVAGAAPIAHYAPPEPVVTRAEVAAIAAARVMEATAAAEARQEERRKHDRELTEQQFRYIDAKLVSVDGKLNAVDAKLDKVADLLATRRR